MAKLCPKGKAAAKRKFKVYPSAYANMYASGVCSGKIKPGGRTKKAEGGEVGKKKKKKYKRDGMEFDKPLGPKGTFNTGNPPKRYEVAGGGLMTRPMYKGGGLCTKGMGRAYGKNS